MIRMFCCAVAVACVTSPAVAASPAPVRAGAAQCSATALPERERQRMQTEYRERVRTDGKAAADAWAARQARQFRQRLVDQGICKDSKPGKVAAPSKRVVRGKDGRPCKRTRLVNRNVASVGGGPMQMILVPVCAD